jgi:hypothetical protein
MHEDGDVLDQDDGFLVDWCLSQESSEEAGPAVATSNESIPSPHHRVRTGPEERSPTFPCLITLASRMLPFTLLVTDAPAHWI